MIGVSTGPEAKTVMMFGGQDRHLETALFKDPAPLARIAFNRIENLRQFRAVSPFLVGKGIDGKNE